MECADFAEKCIFSILLSDAEDAEESLIDFLPFLCYDKKVYLKTIP